VTDRVGDVFEGPVGEQLYQRLHTAMTSARALLGLRETDVDRPEDPAELGPLIVAMEARLGSDDEDGAAHVALLDRIRRRFDERARALDQIDRAVGRLREMTSPGTMLAAAPAELCASSDLDRVIVSVISEGMMIPQAAHFRDARGRADAVLQALRANPPVLDRSLIETEVLRRRRATVVTEAQVHPRVHRPTAEAMGWDSYVAAPIVIRGTAIGVVHADRRDQPVDVLHRDVLWEFVNGLAHAYESASLRRALRNERDQMRQFLEWLNARSGELSDAPVALSPPPNPTLPPPEPLEATPAEDERDDRAIFDGIITRRELDVLRLLAEGRTNQSIANQLVVSQGTVKFHVNNILRKLRASNRAEAVSRYLTLAGTRGRG
jgi:DNA-binding CsgD family transcriptional regulator